MGGGVLFHWTIGMIVTLVVLFGFVWTMIGPVGAASGPSLAAIGQGRGGLSGTRGARGA